MGLSETIVFYLLFGAGIAVAIALDRRPDVQTGSLFRIITAFFFWPLYLPILLDRPLTKQPSPMSPLEGEAQFDLYATTIARVDGELESALDSLDGWAENVLADEQDRFAELRSAWRLQADRIRQLDRLLASTQQHGPEPNVDLSIAASSIGGVRYRHSEQARHENVERLHAVRQQLHDDLMGTLAWVRELVSMIHLAKFTGAPASRAAELVAQIATAVEGLSEVTRWSEEGGHGQSSPEGRKEYSVPSTQQCPVSSNK
jgi:hypothetical protein